MANKWLLETRFTVTSPARGPGYSKTWNISSKHKPAVQHLARPPFPSPLNMETYKLSSSVLIGRTERNSNSRGSRLARADVNHKRWGVSWKLCDKAPSFRMQWLSQAIRDIPVYKVWSERLNDSISTIVKSWACVGHVVWTQSWGTVASLLNKLCWVNFGALAACHNPSWRRQLPCLSGNFI